MKTALRLSVPIILSVLAFGTSALPAFAAGPWYVNATVSGGTGDGLSPENATTTIQAAIDAASSGDTIHVAMGIYDEQVVIDGKQLTLQGAGDTTIIRPFAPATLTSTYTFPVGNFWAGATTSTVVLVKNTSAVTLKDFKVDGITVNSLPLTGSPSRLVGVLFGKSSGTIDNVTVSNIKTTDYSNCTYGIEVSGASTGTYSVEVKNSRLSDWACNGIVADGVNITANINHNTLVGPGTISGQVANGILFIGGASGNATSNSISGTRNNNTSSSLAVGVSVFGSNTSGILLDQNTIYDTDNGINLSGSSHNITVNLNNLRNNLETGIHLEDGTANNTITNNTITCNSIAGIRFAGAGDPTFTGDPPGAGNVANRNTITCNAIGIVNYDGQTFDARNNWWEDAYGPGGKGSGAGDSISGNVTFAPWYVNSGKTILSNAVEGGTVTVSLGPENLILSSYYRGQIDLPDGVTNVVLDNDSGLDLTAGLEQLDDTNVEIGDETVIMTRHVVLLSGGDGGEPIVLTNSDLPGFSVSIPDGTRISGPAGWNGTIESPKADTGSGDTAPAGFSIGDTVISIGSSAGTLVFDSPVTILLEGVTGTVGYRLAESIVWQTIANVCGGSYTTPTAPTSPGECSINNGTNTKIVTFHFTSFGGMDPIPSPPPPRGHGGGGGSAVATPATPTAPTIPTVSPTTPAIPGIPVAPSQGRVLGAATYNFTKNLAIGSRGAEVTMLQQYLVDNGYKLPSGVTGYFGKETRAAVNAFQKARGIAQVGNVGPLTRAALNKGIIATTPETTTNSNLTASAVSALTTAQMNSIVGLLQAFGADLATITKVRAALAK